MENYKRRRERFLKKENDNKEIGNGTEIAETILNSISNYFLPQIKHAAENKSWDLVILGMFAVMETISEYIFSQKKNNIKFYLENFIDKNQEGFKYSEITNDLNNLRNVIAHQWISKQGHRIMLDETLEKGYEIKDEILHINMKYLYDQFLYGWNNNEASKMGIKYSVWSYQKILKKDGLEKMGTNFLKQYSKR